VKREGDAQEKVGGIQPDSLPGFNRLTFDEEDRGTTPQRSKSILFHRILDLDTNSTAVSPIPRLNARHSLGFHIAFSVTFSYLSQRLPHFSCRIAVLRILVRSLKRICNDAQRIVNFQLAIVNLSL
jgi:hypothetical protein